MKKYKNFITTGCSFTAGLINATNLDELRQQAFVWPHYCLIEMGLENSNFLNFAMSGGGNIAAINNLIYYIELNNQIDSNNTLIGLNLTGLNRYDTICHINHSDSNTDDFTRDVKEKLNINWINGAHSREKISQGSRELQIFNCLCIVQGITYLELKNFDYFFMLMADSIYENAPIWFKNFLDARQHNWVKFDNNLSMLSFVKQQKVVVSESDYHPSKIGHQMLAKHVMMHLENVT